MTTPANGFRRSQTDTLPFSEKEIQISERCLTCQDLRRRCDGKSPCSSCLDMYRTRSCEYLGVDIPAAIAKAAKIAARCLVC
jgi:hypothetical protein